MTQINLPQDSKRNRRNLSATRVITSTLGIFEGFYGIEHGFLETLQGNIRPNGYVIDAIGPAQAVWPGASEPAFTIIPNFFITGILAMIVGLIVIIWAGMCINRKYGARSFLVLSFILFLVGGGFAPLFNGILASLTATRIHQPLNWWRTHLSDNTQTLLVKVWPWSILSVVVVSLVAVEIAVIGDPLAWFLSLDLMNVVLYGIGPINSGLTVLCVIAGFAYDIQKQTDLPRAG